MKSSLGSHTPQVDDLLDEERSKSRFARLRDASRSGALTRGAI